MPSFTFVSTANAFVLRGAMPVFVDIRPDTLNLDERARRGGDHRRARARSSPSTTPASAATWTRSGDRRAPRPAASIEDAAHGAARDATTAARSGAIGDLGALSFHETKNVHLRRGRRAARQRRGARRARRDRPARRAPNRRQFFRGQVDKYTWVDVGSSYLPSEIDRGVPVRAARGAPTRSRARRLDLWSRTTRRFAELEASGLAAPADRPDGLRAQRPHVLPAAARHRRSATRSSRRSRERGVNAVFHYVPLHDSPAGRRYGRAPGDLHVTERESKALIRLPLWMGMEDSDIERVVSAVDAILAQRSARVHVATNQG